MSKKKKLGTIVALALGVVLVVIAHQNCSPMNSSNPADGVSKLSGSNHNGGATSLSTLDAWVDNNANNTSGFSQFFTSNTYGSNVVPPNVKDNTDGWTNEYPFPGGSDDGGLLTPAGIAAHIARYTFKINSPRILPPDRCVQISIDVTPEGFANMWGENINQIDVPFVVGAFGQSVANQTWPPRQSTPALTFYNNLDCSSAGGKTVYLTYKAGGQPASIRFSAKVSAADLEMFPMGYTLFAYYPSRNHFVHRFVYSNAVAFQLFLNDKDGACDPNSWDEYRSVCYLGSKRKANFSGTLIFQNIGAPGFEGRQISNRTIRFFAKRNGVSCTSSSPCLPFSVGSASTNDQGFFTVSIDLGTAAIDSYVLSYKIDGEITNAPGVPPSGANAIPPINYIVGKGPSDVMLSKCVNQLFKDNDKEYYMCVFVPLSNIPEQTYVGNVKNLNLCNPSAPFPCAY